MRYSNLIFRIAAQCLFLLSALNSSASDTVKIQFFLDSNIQQYRGVQWHRICQKIPRGSYRKAILKIDLGCASYGCCAWDYLYQGYFSRASGDSFQNIEVARLITPYSSYMRKGKYGYDSTWVQPYYFDVTDYLPWISGDSLYYSAQTGGWDNKGKFGFKHTVCLYLIQGTTEYQPDQVIPVLSGAYRYIDSSRFDASTKPYYFQAGSGARYAKCRIIITGHDQEGEFSPVRLFLNLNGRLIYTKRLWKENCDQNSLQPQSGTWIFSRCNWCPGEKVEEIEVDLSSALLSDSNCLDMNLGTIESKSDTIHASYSIEAHIIRLKNKAEYDIELTDILSPTMDIRYRTLNPSSADAIVKVKNLGNSIARTMHFEYGTLYGEMRKFSWKGELKPYESAEIRLPMKWALQDWMGRTFYVRLIKSLHNRYALNDTLVSTYPSPDRWKSGPIVLEIQTTNDSTVNTLSIFRDSSQRLLYKNYFNNRSIYRDTIGLPPGNYRLELNDRDPRFECGDGLSFWYSNQVYKKSEGSFRIRNATTGVVIREFNPDFGGKLRYSFIIGD